MYHAKGEYLLDSGLEAPNRAVAKMMVLSELCRDDSLECERALTPAMM